MKTNVTCSLDADLVARLDAWRAPMQCGRSHALELLLESLPEPAPPTVVEVVIPEFTSEFTGEHFEVALGAERTITLPVHAGETVEVTTTSKKKHK